MNKKPRNFIRGSIRSLPSGDLVVSVLVDDLTAIANERGYASIIIRERKAVDAYGNTHFMYENDYKPSAGGSKSSAVSKTASKTKAAGSSYNKATTKPSVRPDDDDLPF